MSHTGLPSAGRIEPVCPSREAPIPLPGNNPAMVPATVAAIPGLPLRAVNPSTPPATPPSPGPTIRFTP